MAFNITGNTIMRAILFTAIALVALGLVKSSAPDLWAKVPGLNQF